MNRERQTEGENAETTSLPSERVESQGQVRSSWLLLARIIWTIITLLSLLQFVVLLPAIFKLYWQVCQHQCALTETRPGVWGISPTFYASYHLVFLSVLMVVCSTIGILLFWQTRGKQSVDFMAFLASLMMVTIGPSIVLNIVYLQWPPTQLDAATMLGFGLLSCGNILLILFLFLFPNGRFAPGWMIVPVSILISALLFCNLFLRVAQTLGVRLPAYVLTVALVIFTLMTVGAFALSVASQVYKYRRISTAAQQQQTKWIVLGIVVLFVAFIVQQFFNWVLPSNALTTLLYMTIAYCAYLCLPLSIGLALLRYQLWNVTILINRALVYGVLTALVIGWYVLVVGGLGTLLQASGNPLISLLAIGMIALLIHPLRIRLQQAVNRLLYGERDDPYTVLSRLGQRLEMAMAAEALLPTIAETVAGTFKIPYAAVTLKQGEQFSVVAAYGQPTQDLLHFPLKHQTEVVGELILAPRSPGEPFTTADKRLLADLERQAGATAHSVILARALQRSRERLVTAREEERRRIRRDLHDGLGPVLGSQMLKLDALRQLMQRDLVRAESLLVDLKQQTQLSIAEIRRLVYDLRPQSLDELGLIFALQEQAAYYERSGVKIIFEIAQPLPLLSAAQEVAIYRIIQEALTNVVRHAQAQNCTVRLTWEDTLSIEICDDGRGLPEQRRSGIGLSSMFERASELGGICTIEMRTTGGTCVHVCIPLLKEDIP
ncbi:histidine kinase [Ktedonosporobacter rubrisoli]|uniref:histidine kinase n=1 Tax=Ktedonosporobacter rubrisoli TaxID=2509675 RepID=A0A4P6K0G6_KTERU|nr:sensor histidine kinase [Ktedonosporobacter rubrisoli]QBD81627.1 histidine kinase [Ktedonosporobacter rubrisoli]